MGCRGQDGIDIGLVILGLVGADEAVKVLDDRGGDGVEFSSAADAVDTGITELWPGRFLALLDGGGGIGKLMPRE